MFYIYTKNRMTYKGFIYNQNDEKLEDVRTINREMEKMKDGRLVISGDSEVIVFFDDISKVERVTEQDLPEQDLPF